MISDFIEEKSNDFLFHDGTYSRLALETQKDGYFRSELFLKQIQESLHIFEKKYPGHQALYLLDNAPIHCKCSDDSWRKAACNEGHNLE